MEGGIDRGKGESVCVGGGGGWLDSGRWRQTDWKFNRVLCWTNQVDMQVTLSLGLKTKREEIVIIIVWAGFYRGACLFFSFFSFSFFFIACSSACGFITAVWLSPLREVGLFARARPRSFSLPLAYSWTIQRRRRHTTAGDTDRAAFLAPPQSSLAAAPPAPFDDSQDLTSNPRSQRAIQLLRQLKAALRALVVKANRLWVSLCCASVICCEFVFEVLSKATASSCLKRRSSLWQNARSFGTRQTRTAMVVSV